jgi:hypothetical protein
MLQTNLNFFQLPTIPMICVIAFATDLYLASALTLNRDILGCFLKLHEIRLDLRKTSWPHVDPQSYGQPALANPLINNEDDLCRKSPSDKVYLRANSTIPHGLELYPKKELVGYKWSQPVPCSIWAHTLPPHANYDAT